MQTSATGRALIEACEGLRLKAYRDAVGVLTVGFGHTTAAGKPIVKEGMELTGKAEADSILASDLKRVEDDVSKCLLVETKQCQFDALISFTYNLGIGNFKNSTLLRKVNAGDFTGAAAEFGRWNKAGGKVLAGLTKRRKAERLLFEGNADEALYTVGAATPLPPDVEPVQKPKPKITASVHAATTATVTAGSAVVAAQSGLPWWQIAIIAVAAGAVAFLAIHLVKKG